MTRGGMRRRYTARTGAPPLPRRPRFWPRKPAETGPSGPFFAAEPRVPETRADFGWRPGRRGAGAPEKSRF